MATSKQLHRIATNPTDMVRYMQTGRLPQSTRPASPLITVLESLRFDQLVKLRGLVVDHRLGYSGTRRFDNAAQALRWAKPAQEVFGSFYAESWLIRGFSKQLTLADLQACALPPLEPSAKAS